MKNENVKPKILIVDDRRENLAAIRQVLKDVDVDIVEATNGNEALTATLHDRFAVAILDVMMPGMDGYELAEHLRSDNKTKVIPIVFVTASYADELHIFRGYEAGGIDYIVKPFDPQVLLGKVKIFLELDRYREELRRHRDHLEVLVRERTSDLIHLNAVIRSIRDVNQLIVREKRRGPLIEAACRSLVRTRGFDGAWIVLTDRPGKVHSAQAGLPDEPFREFAERFGRGDPPNCCRRAISEGGLVAIGNPVRECGDCPLSRSHNGGAGLGVALVHGGRDFGYMGISLSPEYVNDEEEKSLLAEVAGDIVFALHGMDVEAERKRSEQTLHAIFDSASDGILLADAESGRFVVANNAICRMLGYTAEEIKTLSVEDIHPVESVDYVRSQFEKQARGEITLAGDIPVKRKDGRFFSADVSSAPLKLEGSPHLLGIFRDITERKEAEKALKEAYDIVNRSSSVAFTWRNAEGWPVEFVSENVKGLLGYSAGEFIRGEVNYTGCIHPEDLARVAEEVVKHSSEAETLEFVHEPYRIIAKDGSEKIVRDWTFIVRDNDAQITHYKGIVEDITELKQAEEARKAMEEQFRQSQKLEAVGRLSGGIAHDFNNLLTTILGNADMVLMDTDKEDPRREMIEEIKGAGVRASNLTRQLLAFSRKQILQPEVIRLNEVVKDIEKMLRRIIGEDIELTTDLAPDLGEVEADVGQIEQVIMNLCVNAKDAMIEGGKLTIETGNVELGEAYALTHMAVTPGPYVMLAVSDTGIGMAQDLKSQIFEPFFTTKEKSKGTGLGLSTVYGIVKQSNGNIWVYSEPGKGTTFKIYLPVHEGTSQARKETAREEGILHGSETILLVEDDEMVGKTALKALEGYGYIVLYAPEGQEALRILREYGDPIHLMLTDVVMPGMSGGNLAARARGEHPDLKVLYMSGYTDNDIVHKGFLDKGIAFLQKPFTPDRLARKVREVLES